MSRQHQDDPTNLPARRGGQPGNTNALRHGKFSTRFTNLSRLTTLVSTPAISTGPLGRQLDLLAAVIEDLAAQDRPAPQLLVMAIKTFAQVSMTNALLVAANNRPPSGRRGGPGTHSNCTTCNAIWIKTGLDDQGRCPRCALVSP